MSKGSRYDEIDIKIEIGHKSEGWECIAQYRNFNLWGKKTKTGGYTIKECFPLNTVPNRNANYEVA